MSIRTLGQLRQQIAQNTQAGVLDTSTGIYDFSTDTYPTLDYVNQMINDTLREVPGAWDYTFLETNRTYPFYHTISGVQGVYLEGTNGVTSNVISGTIIPYPSQVMYYTQYANNSVTDESTNFSGISFTGYSGTSTTLVSGVSTSGSVTYGDFTTVGFTYQMDNDIDKIIAVVVSQNIGGAANIGQGYVMQYVDFHDLETAIPIGLISASGTPVMYTEMPGLGPDTNKVLQFYPFPTVNYSGQVFNVHYKKKHVDMVDDDEKQNVIPEQFQYLVNFAVSEKIYTMLDNPKAALMSQEKERMITDLKVWDANQPDKIRRWRDYNYRVSAGGTGRSAYDTSQLIYLP